MLQKPCAKSTVSFAKRSKTVLREDVLQIQLSPMGEIVDLARDARDGKLYDGAGHEGRMYQRLRVSTAQAHDDIANDANSLFGDLCLW